MSNQIHNTDSGQVLADAAAWLARLDRGLSEEEIAELSGWIDSSAVNRNMLFKTAALWDDLCVLSELSALFPLDEVPRQRRRAGRVLSGAIAASLFLLVSVVGWFNFAPANSLQHLDYTVALQTRVGEHKTESLPDGSSILLNTQTQVDVFYSSASRFVTLKFGEAHFDVVHDPERPFIVKAGNSYIRAIGTAFNIHLARNNQLELLVREGVVSVHKDVAGNVSKALGPVSVTHTQNLKVEAGEKMLIATNAASRTEKIELASIQAELAWQQGMLVFQGEPLHEALVEVSRYNAVEFRIEDASIADIHVAGYYKAGDIDGLLVSLEDNFGIRSHRVNGNQIVLTRSRQ